MTNTTLNNALGIHEDSRFTRMLKTATQLSRLSLMQKRVPKQIVSQIDRTLRTINGQRRIRLLDLDDILWIMRKAVRTDEAIHDHGGTVANCYGYPAYATAALAFTVGRFLYLEIIRAGANRGSTGFGRLSRFNKPGARERYLTETLPKSTELRLNCHLFLLTGK